MALALTAAFALVFFLIPAQALAVEGSKELTVELAGSGEGVVSSEGAVFGGLPWEGVPPIECFGAPPGEGFCKNKMELQPAFGIEGVIVTATPLPGSEFAGWEVPEGGLLAGCGKGGLANEPNECFVGSKGEPGKTNAKAIATFKPSAPPPSWLLTLKKEGTGEGWVLSTPAGINCGLPCTERSALFPEGTVTLHAYGREFAGWAACPGTVGGTQNRDCTISLTEAKVAKATFTDKYALTLEKTGTGTGWVLSTPAGINCGSACTARTGYFTEGTLVELYVYGSQFTGWTACPGTEGGTVNGKNRKCSTIEMTADKVAKPNFTA